MTVIALSISTRGLKADLAYERGDVDSEGNLVCCFTFGNASASAMGLERLTLTYCGFFYKKTGFSCVHFSQYGEAVPS